MLAVAERETRLNDLRQLRSALDQRSPSHFHAVEVEKIEGEEHQPLRIMLDGRGKRIEVGGAVLVFDDDFAVHDSREAAYAGASLDDGTISARRVIAVPSEGPD